MGSFNQAMLDVLRGMNTRTATVDPNAPIPRPGQPTNTQINPILGSAFPTSEYINQDVNAFNAAQTLPSNGTWNGQPIPQSPTSSGVTIPGYGNVSVPYTPGMGDAALNGRPPPSASGWHSPNTRQLFGNLMAQYMNDSMTPEQWTGMLGQGQGQSAQQQQTRFAPSGMYGRQAMQMAGMRGPDSYPNGLLGGKGGAFRPGGK